MSTDIIDDENDGEEIDENVFKPVRKEATSEDQFPDENDHVLNTHKINTKEDEQEKIDSYPAVDLSKNGIQK